MSGELCSAAALCLKAPALRVSFGIDYRSLLSSFFDTRLLPSSGIDSRSLLSSPGPALLSSGIDDRRCTGALIAVRLRRKT